MRILSNNNKSNSGLVVILHGRYSNINSTLVKNIFNAIKNIDKRVVLFEFSYVRKKVQPDPEQIIEAKELIYFLHKQKYKDLTIVAHSNGGFISLVASTMGLEIDRLIFLGISSVQKEETSKIIASMLKSIARKGIISIIQATEDEYTSLLQVKNFLNFNKLKVGFITMPGDHHFTGYEYIIAEKVKSVLENGKILIF